MRPKIIILCFLVCISLSTPSLAISKFVQLKAGWNMLSIPLNILLSANDLKTQCGTTNIVWHYDPSSNSYFNSAQLQPNLGYWLKLGSDCLVSFTGEAVQGSYDLKVGWNQIGSFSETVNFNDVKGDCVVTSGPWKYDPTSNSYVLSSTLEPGYGYWVKTTNNCKMNYGVTQQICSDGTAYGQCSSTKPKYCSSGTLINSCSQCGCSSGTCQSDGMCKNIAPSKNFKIVGMIDGFDVDKRWNPSSVGYQGYRLSDDPSLNILTHANYGGIGCNLDGSVTLWDDPKLKETVAMAHGKTPQIKVLGRFYADGPTATSAFSTTTNYNRLVQQLLNLVSNYDLDGLDIDIEGDVTSSGIGCNSRRVCLETFLLDLRNRMPPGKLLTIDSGYGTGSYDPSATFINTNLDWINVMSYDFATWYGIFDELEKQSPYPNMYHSLYEDVVLVMNNWIAQGVDRDKIVMGVPTYVVDGDRTHTSYKDVVDKINPPSSQDLATGISSISTFWNDGTLAVTYGRLWWNGIDTVKKKVNFVAVNDLGGVMFCSMGFDALNNPKSLTQAAYNTLMQYSTTPTCSSPSYPSDRWQRVWYTHSTFACLGNSPDETNVQFDNNWAEGTVAYSMTDDIEFHSSRTINIPITGTYTFSLGSDDGARLFIDGVSQMDQLVDQPYTINTKDIYLTAGNHLFQINYYENGGAARVTFSYVAKTTPTLTVFHFATVIAYGDTQIREHVNQFNTIAGKTLYGYDTWAGQYPNGWGADWAYLLGSGSQGVLPLFQDGTLKALALVWTPTVDQDQQTQKEIIAGKWDSYIRSIADECKAFGYPIYIRFGGEMNILQQPSQWAANPTDFVNTWKHVVDVFRAKGVTNVQWVWNPNWADDPDGTINFREYYPGDDYVDWVAIDMYQYGYGPDYAWWSDPEYELNGRNGDSIYDEYAPRKPIAICEYATNGYQWEGNQETDTPDAERADWLTKFFNAVEARPQIKWIGYYYAYNGHWAFDSSTPLTTAVYQQRIANPMYVGAEPTTSATFVEACDTFDTSIWTYEWAPPKAQNGEWIYNLPAGVVTRIVPRSVKENYFGYGHYKIRFRTSGPRVAPNIYSSFFYHTGASGSYNELDIPELNGAHSSTTMSISTFHNSNLDSGGNPIDNKDYRYFTSSINFEDTAYHIWEWDWIPGQVRFWVDGVEQDIDPNDGVGVLPWTSTLIAEPPTIFYPMSVGPYPSETTPPATSWTLYVDQIEYTPVTTTPSSCSSPNYPTDRWQRTWNVYSTGACLGNGPDETNIQFDNDWSTGTVAYNSVDDVEFQSSRTINLPAGTYTFTLGSDDGARLWIDDVLYIGSWVDRTYTTDTAKIYLESGNHNFRIEYFENTGAARVAFSYTSTTTTPTYKFTMLTATGGTTDPAPGVYMFTENTRVDFTAYPLSGYKFVRWLRNGVYASTDNPSYFIMDADKMAQPMFETTTTTEPQGTVYWTSRDTYGFESGAITIDKDTYGQIFNEEGGTSTIETSIVYKGNYALRQQSTRRAHIARWGPDNAADPSCIRAQTDAYYGWAFYLKPGYSVPDWGSICQVHTMENTGQYAQLELVGATNPTFRLVSARYDDKDTPAYHELWNGGSAPQGKWFTVIMHLVLKTAANGGGITLWINENPTTSPGAGTQHGPYSLGLQSIEDKWAGGSMDSGVYQEYGGPNNWLVVDEMICASTLEKVVEFLKPDTQTPSETVNIGGTFYPIQEGNIVIVDKTIQLTQSFDGNGITLKHGPNLGPNMILNIGGNGVTLSNTIFDDDNYDEVINNLVAGGSGAVSMDGDGNTITGCTLINCKRYGFNTGKVTNFKITNNIVYKSQYGISGSDYGHSSVFSENGLVSGNKIYDSESCGIKMKMWKNVIVENNYIDIGWKSWVNGPFPSRPYPVGIEFYHTDTPTEDVTVRYNTIVNSLPGSYDQCGGDTVRGVGIRVAPDTHSGYDWWYDASKGGHPDWHPYGMKILNNIIDVPFEAIVLDNTESGGSGGTIVQGNTIISGSIKNNGYNNQIS